VKLNICPLCQQSRWGYRGVDDDPWRSANWEIWPILVLVGVLVGQISNLERVIEWLESTLPVIWNAITSL